jgi:hypothetical protein
MIFLNVFLGTLVVTVGLWIIWGTASLVIVCAWALVVGLLLWMKAESITEVWAWSTLVLGLESFVWPVTLMVQLKGTSETPTEDEMGTILSAVVLGLFSSVFWLSFSYGLFKRAWRLAEDQSGETVATESMSRETRGKKTRKR